mgnify:CR=1 FL=1
MKNLRIATFNVNNVNRRLPNLLAWLKRAIGGRAPRVEPNDDGRDYLGEAHAIRAELAGRLAEASYNAATMNLGALGLE